MQSGESRENYILKARKTYNLRVIEFITKPPELGVSWKNQDTTRPFVRTMSVRQLIVRVNGNSNVLDFLITKTFDSLEGDMTFVVMTSHSENWTEQSREVP